MLDAWKNGEFLKPSIELYNHDELGWFISTVALLGSQSAGIKGLKTNIEAFKEVYKKFVFCDEFTENNIKKSGGNQMTKTIEEIEKELRSKISLEFKDEISTLKTQITNKDEEIVILKGDVKKFADDKKADEEARTAIELKKFNEKVEAEKVVMKNFGYKEEEIKKFSDKFTDKFIFSDVIDEIKHFDQTDSINEKYEFNEDPTKKNVDENDNGSVAGIL